MSYRIVYLPESIKSLNQIAEYLAERSAIAPFTVIGEIRDKISNLERMPRIGQQVEKRPRFRRLVAGNFLIFYEIDEDKSQVKIADVIDSRQQREIDRFFSK